MKNPFNLNPYIGTEKIVYLHEIYPSKNDGSIDTFAGWYRACADGDVCWISPDYSAIRHDFSIDETLLERFGFYIVHHFSNYLTRQYVNIKGEFITINDIHSHLMPDSIEFI